MSDNEGKNVHLSRDEYKIIVTWMEVEANFAAIHGTGGRLAVGGKPKIKKIDAFSALATHLIRHTENTALRGVGLTGRNMQQRWNTYKSRFKRTMKKHRTETGLGITRRELSRGISIPQKLDQMCPLYSRMQVLFGDKANITPSDTVELGLPSTDGSGDDNVIDDLDDNFTQTDNGSECDLTFAPLAQSQMASLATLAPTPEASTQEALSSRGTIDFGAATVDVVSSLTTGEDWVEASPTYNGLEGRRQSTLHTKTKPTTLVNNGKRPATPKYRQVETKRQKANSENTSKAKPPTTAQDTRVSLSKAYALNAEAKIEYMNNKLEEERRQWNVKQDEEKKQRAVEIEERRREAEERRWIRTKELEENRRQWDAKLDAEKQQRIAEAKHRERESEERRSIRKQELLLELLRQNKSQDEIKSFLAMLE